ncbi:MAG: hybrid sensor histidine kinase/response regulator, partial [Candidatus Anammoxibacter sp.]
MDKKEKEFLEKLQEVFKIEANERLELMTAGMLELENAETNEDREANIERIFREAHSLKGAARAASMTDIEITCQALEGTFAVLKTHALKLSPELFDAFSSSIDILTQLISTSKTAGTATGKEQISSLIETLNLFAKGRGAEVKKLTPKISEKRSEADEQTTQINKQTTNDGKPKTEGREAGAEELNAEEQKAEECITHDTSKNEQKPVAPVAPKTIEPTGNDNTSAIHDSPKITKEQTALSDMVRVSTSKLDSILLQAEEMIPLKMKSHRLAEDVENIVSMFNDWTKNRAKMYPEVRQILNSESSIIQGGKEAAHNPHFAKLQEFIDWNYTYTKSMEDAVISLSRLAEEEHNHIDIMTDDLLDDIKRVLMLPALWLLGVFPKMVRDLSRELGKEVKLTMHGDDVEIDRRILEEMKMPLIHILRNSVDHGIEMPEQRVNSKKERAGVITISISHIDANKVEICVSDDGAGIDIQRVKEVAIKQGVISQDQAENLNEEEALSLILQSGVSTSSIITDISGRGLGLAILQENVKKLGGSISVKSTPAEGTTFKMIFPLTLATFRGVFVETADQVFVIPSVNVELCARISRRSIKTVENREVVVHNGQSVPLFSLSDVLELPRKAKPMQIIDKTKWRNRDMIHLVFVNVAGKTIAFSVDNVQYEQELLVKKLGKQLQRVRNIMGATILPSGKAVAILNVYDLIKSASKITGGTVKTVGNADETEMTSRSILVVEDSITSRMLLKNILETAGYVVTTAVDGVDAFTILRKNEFDLVVSDIEMPRLDGFGLTLKIRKDEKLAEMPMVLVTSLESKDDRERGIDVGADAYIVKSDFDQSNLISVIGSLI